MKKRFLGMVSALMATVMLAGCGARQMYRTMYSQADSQGLPRHRQSIKMLKEVLCYIHLREMTM